MSFNVIKGTPGVDTLYGSIHDDSILGGRGNDVLYGEAGNDILRGGLGDDILYGGTGDDTLYSGRGDGIVTGDVNFATATDPGGAYDFGDDVMIGGIGEHTLYGDAYQYEVDNATGGTIVTTFGDDEIQVKGLDDTAFFDVQNLYVDMRGGAPGDVVLQLGDDVARSAFETAYGDAQRLILTYHEKAGDVVVLSGDDKLAGRTVFGDVETFRVDGLIDPSAGQVDAIFGHDEIQLTGPNAKAYGDARYIIVDVVEDAAPVQIVAGDDTILSGEGNDALWGDYETFNGITQPPRGVDYQSGRDTFVFAGNFGIDTVHDFEQGKDILEFRGFAGLDFNDFNFVLTQVSGVDHVLVSALPLGNDGVLIQGRVQLTEDDFAFV